MDHDRPRRLRTSPTLVLRYYPADGVTLHVLPDGVRWRWVWRYSEEVVEHSPRPFAYPGEAERDGSTELAAATVDRLGVPVVLASGRSWP